MPNWLIPVLINRILPVLVGSLATLLVEHGLLEPETVQAISNILGGQ